MFRTNSNLVLAIVLGVSLFALDDWAIKSLSFASAGQSQPAPKITLGNAANVQLIKEFVKDVRGIEWSHDGKEIAFLFWEMPVEVVDAEDFKPLRTIGKDKKLIHFTYGADRDQLAFCQNSKTAEILNVRSGRSIRIETENDQPGLALSKDGRFLATGGYGTEASIWSASSGRLVRTLSWGEIQAGGLTPVYSPDSKTIAIGNRNSITAIFGVESGELIAVLSKEMSQGLCFDPKGKTVAVGYVDGNVGLWNAADGKLLRMRKSTAKEIYKVAWSPNGEILASAGLEGSLTLWDAKDLTIIKELKVPEWISDIKFSPDGTRLLSAGGGRWPVDVAQRKVQVWGVRKD